MISSCSQSMSMARVDILMKAGMSTTQLRIMAESNYAELISHDTDPESLPSRQKDGVT